VYVFAGAEFWQYDRSRNSYTPRALAQWKGVPAGLDAAFFHGGYTYFFKAGLYYRFDDVAFKVDDGSPPFPRSSAAWWFGCKHTARAHELTAACKSALKSRRHEEKTQRSPSCQATSLCAEFTQKAHKEGAATPSSPSGRRDASDAPRRQDDWLWSFGAQLR
ncbi:Uncharacterized protein GBIM_20710, partial [Gryllus bimaculatus]